MTFPPLLLKKEIGPKCLHPLKWQYSYVCNELLIIALHLFFITFLNIICLVGFQMQILLQTWPKLESEQALELLDYTFADQAVRRIAVECIEKMRW